MRRRQFIGLLGGAAAAWPRAAYAQKNERVRRLAVVSGWPADNSVTKVRFAAFRQELERLGWSQEHNIHIDYRFVENANSESVRAAAKQLIALNPDVIFAPAFAFTVVRPLTQTIPIVFAEIAAPVERGFVASLARPGGNVTGFAEFDGSLAGKWLGLLREVVPKLARSATMFNPDVAPHAPPFLQAVEAASRAFAMVTTAAPVRTADEIEADIASLGRIGDSALLVIPDSFTRTHREITIGAAQNYRVPAMYPDRIWVDEGGLMAYSDDFEEQYRGAAAYVDRILKGAKPADLPVQEPTKYKLVVNLKAAKAIGLTIPYSMQLLADEVIE